MSTVGRRLAALVAVVSLVTFVFEFRASWTDLMRPLIYLLDQFGQGGEASGRSSSPPASSPPCPC